MNAKFRYGATALFKAAERGHTDIAKLLLARGADVTVKDTSTAPAMSWALDNNMWSRARDSGKGPSECDDVLTTGVREEIGIG